MLKPEQPAVEHLNIKVTDGPNEVFFKIKKTTQLKKLMDAFCERQGKRKQDCRFLFDGERVNEEDTPLTVSLDTLSGVIALDLRPLLVHSCNCQPCDGCTARRQFWLRRTADYTMRGLRTIFMGHKLTGDYSTIWKMVTALKCIRSRSEAPRPTSIAMPDSRNCLPRINSTPRRAKGYITVGVCGGGVGSCGRPFMSQVCTGR